MWWKGKLFPVKRHADEENMIHKPEGILVTIKKNKICRKIGATRNHAEQNETDSEKQQNFFSLSLSYMSENVNGIFSERQRCYRLLVFTTKHFSTSV